MKKIVKDKKDYDFFNLLIWIVFMLSILFFSAYKFFYMQYLSNAYTMSEMISFTDEEIINKYKDNNYFVRRIKEVDDEILFLDDQIKLENDNALFISQKKFYEDNRIMLGVMAASNNNFIRISYKELLIFDGISILIFVIGYILVNKKKFKIFNIINGILLLGAFLGFFIHGNIKLFDNNVTLLVIILPIVINYINYVIKKEA